MKKTAGIILFITAASAFLTIITAGQAAAVQPFSLPNVSLTLTGERLSRKRFSRSFSWSFC